MCRGITAGVMLVLWGWWLGCEWVRYTQDVSALFLVMLQGLRAVAMVSSVFLLLSFLVAPVVATARMWREIGMREQSRNCKCPARDNVVAFRPARYGTSDS